jgi:choline dehydrogenase-like flavoprotein
MGTAASSPNLGFGFPTPGPQSPTGQRVMDHVFFLSNAEWKEARETGRYDLVIVGTGFCGLAVADRALDKNPNARILLIERGPFFLPEHFQNLPMPFVATLGGLSETFPWTLTARTAEGRGGVIRWQHGMVPFFGGRSTLWSAWCPRPTPREMAGWPEETIEKAIEYFEPAERLLHVQPADEVDAARLEKSGSLREMVTQQRPVYGRLQKWVQTRLADGIGGIDTIYRSEPAPLASDAESVDGIDFQKYSTPGALLELVMRQRERADGGA